MPYTNYAGNIFSELKTDLETAIADITVLNVRKFPDLESDSRSFFVNSNRAVLFRLESMERLDQWNTQRQDTYNFTVRCYVLNSLDDQAELWKLVEEVIYELYQIQSGQTNWYSIFLPSVTFAGEEAEEESSIDFADIECRIERTASNA